MSVIILVEIAGWAGAVAILSAYLAVSMGWLKAGKGFQIANLLGSCAFIVNGAFHEACTVGIAERLIGEIKPVWLRIGGYWYPRGGIPIDVFWQTGRTPKDLWIPDQGVAPYRGRG